MRLSQVMELVRDEVNDPSVKTYSDEEVVRAINVAHLNIFRIQVQEDRSFHNCEITLAAGLARQIHTGIFRYPVPHFMARVSAVFQETGASSWRGNWIPPALGLDQGGWSLFAGHQLEIRGLQAACDIRVQGTKEPALLTRGELPDQDGLEPNQIRVPALASIDFAYDTNSQKYLNSIVEPVGASGPTTRDGQLRRVIAVGRPALYAPSGGLHAVWTLDQEWDEVPEEGDMMEMHLETPDAANNLIRLDAATQLYRYKGAFDAAAALQQELLMAKQDYREFVQPRDDHMMHSFYEPRFVERRSEGAYDRLGDF